MVETNKRSYCASFHVVAPLQHTATNSKFHNLYLRNKHIFASAAQRLRNKAWWCMVACALWSVQQPIFSLALHEIQTNKQHEFCSEISNKISHLKGLQRTTPVGSGAIASTKCIRTLCLSPTTFLLLWLQN